MGAQMVKNSSAMQGTWVASVGWEAPLESSWQPIPVSLPGESHGHRNLVGHRPWGYKELDVTEQLSTAQSVTKGFVEELILRLSLNDLNMNGDVK